MNLYIISLLEAMIQKKLLAFSMLNIVKSAVYLCDLQKLAIKLSIVADFYLDLLQKIDFLHTQISKKNQFGPFDLHNVHLDTTVKNVLDKLKQEKIAPLVAAPVYLYCTGERHIHFVEGLVRFETENTGYGFLINLSIVKNEIKDIPHNSSYVIDIMKSYDTGEKFNLRDLMRSKGLNYNQFQKDCKFCFGDTFYSFLLKLKMLEAASDIIFTPKSLKEIAFNNKFLDYGNMYKTFVRYGINPSLIPRLAFG